VCYLDGEDAGTLKLRGIRKKEKGGKPVDSSSRLKDTGRKVLKGFEKQKCNPGQRDRGILYAVGGRGTPQGGILGT